jgi:TetR/AcrR family transcriptional regulator, cholesterol catabolism regulator
MARPVDPERPVVEARILLAAARLFAERGYGATSVDDIAREVRLHKSSLYHYIDGKRQLLFDALCRSLGTALASLEKIAVSDASPYERLKRAVEAVVADMIERPHSAAVFLRDRRFLTRPQVRRYVAMRDRYEGILTELLEAAVKQGGCRPLDTSVTVKALLGMCNWLGQWYSPAGRLGPAAIANAYANLFVDRLVYEGRAERAAPRRRRAPPDRRVTAGAR